MSDAAAEGGPGQAGIADRLRRAAVEHLEARGALREWSDALADTAEAHVARMEAALAAATAAVERRVAALDAARDAAEAAAEEARLAVADHKARADVALIELVEGIKEQIGPATKDWRVVKTRIHGAQRIGLVAGLGALGAVALLGAGAGFVAWRDREAVRFHAACAREVVHDARGNLYCPLRGVLAEEGNGT